MLWVVPRIGPVLTSILFFLGVKELSMQFLWGYSGFFPQVSHLNLFALKCCSYSNVAIHSELLYRNYFSYSVSVPDKMTSPGRQSGELHGGQRPHGGGSGGDLLPECCPRPTPAPSISYSYFIFLIVYKRYSEIDKFISTNLRAT